MGQQYSVETLTTTDIRDGGRYWSSFEPYPKKVGKDKLAYRGLLNGTGRRTGEKCVVKVFRKGYATYEDWQCEVMKARIARDYAAKFRDEMIARGYDVTLNFNVPMIADIDEVSVYTCIALLMKKPRKKIKEYEAVSIEPYFEGKFEDFEYGSVPNFDASIAHAYSHFTWFRSCGDLVITGLQGVQQLHKYHLTVPTVHSQNKRYVHGDTGSQGIEDFFSNHRCNDLCRLWPRPDRVMQLPRLSDSETNMIELQLQNISQYNASQMFHNYDMSTSDVFIMRNYPIRVANVSVHHCACTHFGLPCSHYKTSSPVIYATNKCITADAVL